MIKQTGRLVGACRFVLAGDGLTLTFNFLRTQYGFQCTKRETLGNNIAAQRFGMRLIFNYSLSIGTTEPSTAFNINNGTSSWK